MFRITVIQKFNCGPERKSLCANVLIVTKSLFAHDRFYIALTRCAVQVRSLRQHVRLHDEADHEVRQWKGERFGSRNAFLKFKSQVVLTLEGGYNLETIADAAEECLRVSVAIYCNLMGK